MKSLLLVVALLFSTQSSQPPHQSRPPFAAVHGSFFALSVSDVEASARWYTQKLGLMIDKRDSAPGVKVAILSGNGLIVELIQQQDSVSLSSALPSLKSSVQVQGIFKAGLLVDDIDATFRELKARNVEIAFGMFPAKAETPYKNFAIRDNSGNLIQFFGQ